MDMDSKRGQKQPEVLSETLRLILDGSGRSEEYEYYLHRFRSVGYPFFALILPDAQAVFQGGSAIFFHLNFLRRLGLHPVLAFTGPAAASMLSSMKLHGSFHVMEENSSEEPLTIQERKDRLGQTLRSCVESSSHEMHAMGTDGGSILYVPGWSPVDLIQILSPEFTERAHLVRMNGGIRNTAGHLLQFVSEKTSPGDLLPEDRPVFDLIRTIHLRNPGLHVSLTSPLYLLKEIFTVKGSGTMIRRAPGVLKIPESQIDQDRLFELFHRSFRGRLKSRDFYHSIDHFYIAENYSGAALLLDHPRGVYLSKFAVDTLARGEGIAQAIWKEIANRHPAIFWRSRSENSVNRWYSRIADGQHRTGPWTVFWKGIDPECLSEIIRFARERPVDFSPEGSGSSGEGDFFDG